MTVDGKYPERWKTVGRFSYLASSALFLGGSDGRENIPIIRSINNLIGCMKKVLLHFEYKSMHCILWLMKTMNFHTYEHLGHFLSIKEIGSKIHNTEHFQQLIKKLFILVTFCVEVETFIQC